MTSAYLFAKYEREFSGASYQQLLLPSQWKDFWQAYQNDRGNRLIALAIRQIEQHENRDAIFNLRVGLAKAPDNREGRLLLAQILLSARRPDLSRQLLLDGLPYHGENADYLKVLFGFLFQRQEDGFARQLALGLLTHHPAHDTRRAMLAMAAATAGYFRGNYDQAEDDLKACSMENSPDGRLLMAQINWERGYQELALVQLRALAGEFNDRDDILIVLGNYLRASGSLDEFRRLALTRQLAHPQTPRPRIDLLYALQQDGDRERVTRECDAILADFTSSADALTALADFTANNGYPILTHCIYEHCQALGLPSEAPAFLSVEALLVVRDYPAALQLTRRLLVENPAWAKHYAALLNSLQAIAYYGLGDADSAQLCLANFLSQPDPRTENLLAVAQRFLDVGASQSAHRILARAVENDPLNQAALTRLIELDLALGHTDTLPRHLHWLLTMRKPSPAVLRTAYAKLGGDLFLFSHGRSAVLDAIQVALTPTAAHPRL